MSIYEQLTARPVPSPLFRLRSDYGPESDAAHLRLARATQTLRLASIAGPDTDATRDAQAEVDAATAACDGYTIALPLLPMAAKDYAELIAAHPPTETQRAEGAVWNDTTFDPELVAASVQPDEGDDPVTAEQWTELLTTRRVALGEWRRLVLACQTLNNRAGDVRLGKGG